MNKSKSTYQDAEDKSRISRSRLIKTLDTSKVSRSGLIEVLGKSKRGQSRRLAGLSTNSDFQPFYRGGWPPLESTYI